MFLFFVISQFVAYFNYSNMGTILAVNLADLLKEANLNSVTLLLALYRDRLPVEHPHPQHLAEVGHHGAGVRPAVHEAGGRA